MESLRTYLPDFQNNLPTQDEAALKMKRALTVQRVFKEAIEKVYKTKASFVLSHINAVYIKKDPEASTHELIIYADDSLIRADIDARQEFIKMALYTQGEQIQTVKILASRGNIKNHHPFVEKTDKNINNPQDVVYSAVSNRQLSAKEQACIQTTSQRIENNQLSETFQKAMRANLESHN